MCNVPGAAEDETNDKAPWVFPRLPNGKGHTQGFLHRSVKERCVHLDRKSMGLARILPGGSCFFLLILASTVSAWQKFYTKFSKTRGRLPRMEKRGTYYAFYKLSPGPAVDGCADRGN